MTPQNLLLAALPREVHERLSRHMRTVSLPLAEGLHRPNQPIRTVSFPLDRLISITVTMAEARTAEAGIVGSRERVGCLHGRPGDEPDRVHPPGSRSRREDAG